MSRHNWTPQEIALLRAQYPHRPSREIAERLGLTLRKVYWKTFKLGLKKSEEFMASPVSGHLMPGSVVGASNRFLPGHTPWNKGMKGLDFGGKETRFKPGCRVGRAAENYKPIGYERTSRDGYLERKIHDGLPLQSRWRYVHLLVWEAARGPAPAGHVIVFKDGDKRHIALDNLECVSRQELLRRNSDYGPEIGHLIRLRGAITRQINQRKTKETERTKA